MSWQDIFGNLLDGEVKTLRDKGQMEVADRLLQSFENRKYEPKKDQHGNEIVPTVKMMKQAIWKRSKNLCKTKEEKREYNSKEAKRIRIKATIKKEHPLIADRTVENRMYAKLNDLKLKDAERHRASYRKRMEEERAAKGAVLQQPNTPKRLFIKGERYSARLHQVLSNECSDDANDQDVNNVLAEPEVPMLPLELDDAEFNDLFQEALAEKTANIPQALAEAIRDSYAPPHQYKPRVSVYTVSDLKNRMKDAIKYRIKNFDAIAPRRNGPLEAEKEEEEMPDEAPEPVDNVPLPVEGNDSRSSLPNQDPWADICENHEVPDVIASIEKNKFEGPPSTVSSDSANPEVDDVSAIQDVTSQEDGVVQPSEIPVSAKGAQKEVVRANESGKNATIEEDEVNGQEGNGDGSDKIVNHEDPNGGLLQPAEFGKDIFKELFDNFERQSLVTFMDNHIRSEKRGKASPPLAKELTHLAMQATCGKGRPMKNRLNLPHDLPAFTLFPGEKEVFPTNFIYTEKNSSWKPPVEAKKITCDCHGVCGVGCPCWKASLHHGKAFIVGNSIVRLTDDYNNSLVVACGGGCQCSTSCGNRLPAVVTSRDLELIRRHQQIGVGVRTRKPFLPGEIVLEFVGDAIKMEHAEDEMAEQAIDTDWSWATVNNHVESEDKLYKIMAAIQERNQQNVKEELGYLCVLQVKEKGNLGRLVSTSLYPNVSPIRVVVNELSPESVRLLFTACRPIMKDQEIFADYGEKYTLGGCLCGLAPCDRLQELRSLGRYRAYMLLQRIHQNQKDAIAQWRGDRRPQAKNLTEGLEEVLQEKLREAKSFLNSGK